MTPTRRLVLNGLTGALRATQASSLMLSDVFDVLENLAALCATILVRRHGTSPPKSGLGRFHEGSARSWRPILRRWRFRGNTFRNVVEVSEWPLCRRVTRSHRLLAVTSSCAARCIAQVNSSSRHVVVDVIGAMANSAPASFMELSTRSSGYRQLRHRPPTPGPRAGSARGRDGRSDRLKRGPVPCAGRT